MLFIKTFILVRGNEFSSSISLKNKTKTVLCFLCPILFFSRFVVSKYVMSSFFIKRLRFVFVLDIKKRKRKVIPEILFWFLFSLTKHFGIVLSFNKKAYKEGHANYTKTSSTVVKLSNKSFKNVAYLNMFYMYFCANGKLLSSYWFRYARTVGFIHNFAFKDVSFDVRFSRLMNFASRDWVDFKVIISVFSATSSILHFIFLLREFFKVPLFPFYLCEKRVSKSDKQELTKLQFLRRRKP